MSHSYPIWTKISGTERKKQPSFGTRRGYTQTIFVGASASNSHELATLEVECREDADGRKTFSLWLDGERLKAGTYKNGEYTPLRAQS